MTELGSMWRCGTLGLSKMAEPQSDFARSGDVKGKKKSILPRRSGSPSHLEENRIDSPLVSENMKIADDDNDDDNNNINSDEDSCAICLSDIVNRTVISPCQHSLFCFSCIGAWTDQSRKCPLCLASIDYLIHNIRSDVDYQRYRLMPLSATTPIDSPLIFNSSSSRPNSVSLQAPRRAHTFFGRQRPLDDPTWKERREERALERRKYVYREKLFAKHIASNRYTGFKPQFSPEVLHKDPKLKARILTFVRRELQVFPNIDTTFLTSYILSIASHLELRSSAAIRLIAEFLPPEDAEHLAHEIVMFARSPFTSLEGYDRYIQYGRPQRGRNMEANEISACYPEPGISASARPPSAPSLLLTVPLRKTAI